MRIITLGSVTSALDMFDGYTDTQTEVADQISEIFSASGHNAVALLNCEGIDATLEIDGVITQSVDLLADSIKNWYDYFFAPTRFRRDLVFYFPTRNGNDTNLLSYSQAFDNAAWTKSNVTITSNAAVAPDGTTTANKLVENTDTGAHHVYQAKSIADDTTVCVSLYCKAAERSKIHITIRRRDGSYIGITFDLENGFYNLPAVGYDCGMESLSGGWWRIWFAGSNGTGSLDTRLHALLNNGSTTSYTGDGSSGLYIWGAQLEQASSPSHYIPTPADGNATITINKAGGTAKCGLCLPGTAEQIGFTRWGVRVGINDYSIIDTDVSGQTYLSAGDWAKRAEASVGVRNTAIDAAIRAFVRNHATAAVFDFNKYTTSVGESDVSTSGKSAYIVYGFADDVEPRMPNNRLCDVDVSVWGLR